MARVKKKIVAKDYNSLIKISKDKIEKLTQDLKEEKTNLKLLEKDAASYEKQLEEERKQKEIVTTKQLVEIIEKSIPRSKQNDGHPAKRTFQAIRIEVNDEIKPLYNTIKNCIECLNDNGRLCVITFHSLEDRAVKNAMNDAKGKCTCPSDLPYCVCGAKSLGKIITRKPIVATEEELEQNSRSKSAKLRIFERVY